MDNSRLVTSFLNAESRCPPDEPAGNSGLKIKLDNGQLLLSGRAQDLLELADLLVSLALSGENQGQHWHIDDVTLMDSTSEIPELILLRK